MLDMILNLKSEPIFSKLRGINKSPEQILTPDAITTYFRNTCWENIQE